MGLSSGPNSATLGLTASLDAGDRKNSFLPFSTFLNMSTWALGSGGCSGYGQNGNTNENERVIGTDPWGNNTVVWESRPTGTADADGGWNTDWYSIDRTKLYRFSVWVKRTSDTAGGTSYLGLYGNTGGGVEKLNGTGTEGNPYWECNGTGAYTKDVWYLLVGHCFPYGTTGVANNRHPDTGRYTVDGRNGDLNYCNIGGDVKWLSDTTATLHRTYHYYCGDNTTHLQWFDPRIDLCDGTEPSISDLLIAAPDVWRNSFGGSLKGTLTNGVSFTPNNKGTLIFDGTNDRVSLPAILSAGAGQYTIEAVFKASSIKTQVVWEQNSSTVVQNERACMILLDNGLGGFNGQGNDFHSIIPYTTGVWYHWVIVVDKFRTTNTIKLYNNGTLYSEGNPSNGAVNLNVGNYASAVGYKLNANSEYFDGQIPIVRVYNRCLTPSEIKENYNGYKTRFNLG
jgi:hypothetical protein